MRITRFAIIFSHLVCVLLLFIPCPGFAQRTDLQGAVQLNKISTFEAIRENSEFAFFKKGLPIEGIYQQLQFKPVPTLKNEIPAGNVNGRLIMRFTVENQSGEPDSVWFFPGFFFSSIQLYRVTSGRLLPLPNIEPVIDDSIGYRLLVVAPHDSATIAATMNMVKTYTNYLRPRLIQSSHLSTFFRELSSAHLYVNIVTYIFCGMLLMMILFSIANYFLGANDEFLFYAGYAVFLGAMLLTKTYYDYHVSRDAFFLEAYLDFVMQCTGIGLYMIFMQKFLSTRARYRFLDRLYTCGEIGLLASIALFSYTYFFTDNFVLLNGIENTTKTLLLAMMVVFLFYCVRSWKDVLLRYLFWGNILYFFFAVFSQLLILFGHFFSTLPAVFNSSLFYYELGLFLELVFFLAGLSYKNRKQLIEQTREREQLKMENERKEFEKQMAVITAQQEERSRISADMHDELGSGMTHIRLMSEIAKSKMKDATPVELEKISQSADDVLNKMNVIIWSMNSSNDTLGNLISYIRAYATEYLEGTNVHCTVSVPDVIPDYELSGDRRRNIFLCVKETLNNVLKHAHATKLDIDIEIDGQLIIRLADNGSGFNLHEVRQFGNGLKNIDRRMKTIEGSFAIRSNNGTQTVLTVPL